MSASSSAAKDMRKLWQTEMDDYVCGLGWGAGENLAAAAANGDLAILKGSTGEKIHRLGGHQQGINTMAWRPDGRLLASGGQDGLVKFWSLESADRVEELAVPASAPWVEHLQWSRPENPDPTYPRLASAAGRKLKIWDYRGELIKEFPDHPATIAGLHWQPGRQMIAATTRGGVALWGAADGKLHQTLEYRPSPLLQVSWSPNGQWLVAATQDNGVHVWQFRKKQEMHMSGFENKVRAFSWGPAGRFLATDGGTAVSIWDFSGEGPANRAPRRLEWHRGKITAIAFASNSPVLASGSTDGGVAMWRVEEPSAQPWAAVRLEDEISALAWSPDDSILAVGSKKGSVSAYAGVPG